MKTIVILSGGIDSTTLLYYAVGMGAEVKALGFNYGQKHSKELKSAKNICKKLGIDYKIVNIKDVKDLLVSSLTSNEKVPEGYYKEENMKSTVVPNRNAIMLSIAYGYAISEKAEFLLFGAHSGDHFIYPDCRPKFVKDVNKAYKTATEGLGNVLIEAPFIDMTKADIVNLGLILKVPYKQTWSCYKGKRRPCLKCGTCIERTEAFVLNDTKDPLLSDREWEKAINYLGKVKQ